MNFKWPSTRINGLAPSYIIVWHVLWIIPYYLVAYMLFLIIFIANGKYSALEFYKEYLAWG